MTAALAVSRLEGCQVPRVFTRPAASSYSTAGQVVEFAESVGVFLDPWQEFAVREALAEAADGRWAAFEVLLLVARQNGKGEVLMVLELAKLFLLRFGRPPLILHSAHLFPTAQEAFRRIRDVVDGSDVLRREVKRISAAHGEEGIELLDGARLRFMARTVSGVGRGFSPTDLMLDEVFWLPVEAVSANLPALSAQANPQIVYTSSTGFPTSEVLLSLVKRGRRGGDGSLTFMEWSAEPGVNLDDLGGWAAANPAIGYRIREETIRRERASLPDGEFARERLGLWADTSGGALINPELWAKLADPDSCTAGDAIYALDVSLDLKWAALGMAGRRADGLMHVSVDNRPSQGLAWVVPRCRQLAEQFGARFLVDRGGPAWSLVPDLEDAGVTVLPMTLPDVRQADGMLLDAIAEGRLRHRGQPDLDAAVLVARPRPVGEGGPVFGRKSGEITSLNAAAFAHWWAVSNAYDVMASVL